MKTIGILGGMSHESTAHYYRLINEGVRARLGGLHSARIVLLSVDFATIEPLQAADDWDAAGAVLAADARRIEAAIGIPLLHLADATAAAVEETGVGRVALLGTRYTMEQPFYRERLERRGLQVDVPNAADRAELNRIIFEELCQGTIRADSRATLQRMIGDLGEAGATAVIAGCTEITMLVGATDSPLPLFDTTAIHADAAVARALDATAA